MTSSITADHHDQAQASSAPDTPSLSAPAGTAVADKAADTTSSSAKTDQLAPGKRKERLPEYEFETAGFQRGSPPRKKQRTEQDVCLARSELEDFTTPFHAAPEQTNILPSAALSPTLPQYGRGLSPSITPTSQLTSEDDISEPDPDTDSDSDPSSDSETIADDPLPARCGHFLHPSCEPFYPIIYNCPVCVMDYHIKDIQKSQDIILRHGGSTYWHESTQKTPYHAEYERFSRGKMKNLSHSSAFDNISYRHKKRELLAAIDKLEFISDKELDWEKELDSANSEIDVQVFRLTNPYSATSALQKYKDAVDDGSLTRVEQDSAEYVMGKALKHELKLDPEFPEGASPYKDLGWMNSKGVQKQTREENRIAKRHRTDDADLPPQKRHRGERSVTFNDDVYVRSEADVDVLRKQAKEAKQASGRSAEDPGSAPDEPESDPPHLTAHKTPKPARPHYTIPLRSQESNWRRGALTSSMKRKISTNWDTVQYNIMWGSNFRPMAFPRDFEHRQWSVQPDKEFVDTSGATRDKTLWEAQAIELEEEARMLDEWEEHRESEESDDDEIMGDASVPGGLEVEKDEKEAEEGRGNNPEEESQPRLPSPKSLLDRSISGRWNYREWSRSGIGYRGNN